MKIGIPRALLYYYYYPFWKALFESLGCEVVLSDETNAKVMEDGASVTVSELCVPIKIFNGHIVNLLQKQVDYIFLPQFIANGKEFYCPKFMAISEVSQYSIPHLKEKMLVVQYRKKGNLLCHLPDYAKVMDALGVTKFAMKQALKEAKKAHLHFRSLCESGHTILEAYDIINGKKAVLHQENAEATIVLLGYVNIVYDNFVSMNAIQKLRDMGIRVLTFDMLPEDVVDVHLRGKQPFWVFARKIRQAFLHYVDMDEVDGFIHMTAFGCGPDSIIGKLMEMESEEKNKPFMTLRVDEHTGDSHVQTRLEAFADMIKISKGKAGSV